MKPHEHLDRVRRLLDEAPPCVPGQLAVPDVEADPGPDPEQLDLFEQPA